MKTLTSFVVFQFFLLMTCSKISLILCEDIQETQISTTSESLKYEPCIVKKDGHIYDLRTLSQKKHWFYSELFRNDSKLVFYISLCHPVQEVPSCNANDGVCFSYFDSSKDDIDKIKFTSAGKINQQNFTPELLHEGSLRYVYENGNICKKGSLELPYKTELHLQCPYSPDDETPNPILMASPKCMYIFVWMTLAACPITIKTSKDPCIIQFADSEYPLNLHSLTAKTFYKPIGINYTFEINICGPIVNGSCKENTDVCDITNSSNPTVIAEHNETSMSFQWEEKYLVLTYMGVKNKDNSTINVHIYCDRTAYMPKFYFSSKKYNAYTFTLYTVNVCNPKMSDCVIEDKKLNVFDLRPLHKKEGNWEVIGKRSTNGIYKNVLYYINMCGPVNENHRIKCPSGPIGSCQASVSVSGSKNLGFITSHPIVNINKDESLTVLYTGGDPCNERGSSSSTRINLICSHTEYSPTFIEVTESCEHIFDWHTPAACPVNVVSGSDCMVVDPLFGHNFDLNPLRNKTADYHTTNGDHKFLVNICGPLISSCNGSNGTTAVCQLGESEKSGGIVPAELIFNDGSLIMRFSNGSFGCVENQWTSQILFLCSHAEDGSEGLQYIHADDSACIHHFIWHTKYACPPHLEMNCSVIDGDLLYDLTPLSNPNINEIFITYDGIKKYVINVCRSVIHSKESRCSYDAASCLIDLSHENKTMNLGIVQSGPYIEDNHLRVRYENGDKCNSTHKYQTIIEFECTDEEYLSYPVLQAEEECLIYFFWSSVYACPQNLSIKADEVENCTAINPQTKYVFDMNNLKNETPYELHVSEGTTLLLSPCRKIIDSRCKDNNSGACIVNKTGVSSSAGVANSFLKFHMWSTYLEYKGGEICRQNGLKRSTKISFICREKGFPSGPVLISDDVESCSFFVNWYTESACERHINCFAHSWEHIFDLSSLVRSWGNYEVKDPENSNNTYLLNVCRPLNPVIGVNCHPGSAACLVRKREEPLSLGHPILNPSVVNKEEVHLMYAHGSKCPENDGFSLSSRIIFICNRSAGAGEPIFFRETHDCQTLFKWFTSFVCPPVPLEEEHCQIAFEAAKTNVDLTPLRKTTPYRVFYRGRAFLLNMCGASVCNNSGVCTEKDNVSYGLSSYTKLRWEYNNLVMTFYSGSPCTSSLTGFRTSEIYFECDPQAGLGTPEPSPIMLGLKCLSVFYWRTNLTCLETIYKPTNSELPSTLFPNKYTVTTEVTSSTTTTRAEQPNGNSSHHSDVENKLEARTWLSVMVAAFVMIIVFAAIVFVVGRSSHGRRFYAHAKRTLARNGYASAAENDTLLGSDTAFVYRVDEDEHVLRV